MSDLSQPLSLLPIGDEPARPVPPACDSEPFAWPTPPYATYPSPTRQIGPEPCEVQSCNGTVTKGRLVSFDPDQGVARVLMPPARGVLTLELVQFRRLTLTRPLAPLAAAAHDALADSVTRSQCRLHHVGGGETRIETIGHVETPSGLFVFAPLDAGGRVLRSFYPRAGLAEIEIGARIGELLVEQHAVSATAVEQAAAEQQQLRSRKLGDILLTQQVVTPQQLLEAIEQQARMPMVRIGEALVTLGFIDEVQLADALEQQSRDRNVPLGELLVRNGSVTRNDLQTALARKMGYPVVDAATFPIEHEAVLRLPLEVARRLPALPLMLRGGRLVVALQDPTARALLDEIEFSAQLRAVPVLARGSALLPAIERAYQRLGYQPIQPNQELLRAPTLDFETDSADKLLASLESEQHNFDAGRDAEVPIEQSDNSLVRLINTMIVEAQQQGVSDIHVECPGGTDKVRIRFRRDGLLMPYLELPHTYRSALVARLKIMCDLDISERRKPQDGKIAFGRFMKHQQLELRVVTIPTANGHEDVVLRLLASARQLPLSDMGLASETLARLTAAIERPYGMVLCVGPTGQGKTTTLHAALAHLNTPERKIWTAEDPIEITQSGLRQVQVNPRIDWTFAKALRSLLRADPDVIMVGEIRDAETAQVAVEASLTGHLVLSTLHTNSAPETVTRLLDMGMDPFSFADSLLAVLAQRLVRRLCRHCVQTSPASADEIEVLLGEWLQAFPDPSQRPTREDTLRAWTTRHAPDGAFQHHRARGCKQCGDTGFSGRIGVHELLLVDRELRRLIQTNARADELQRSAMSAGMRTLRQDGIEKVLAGLTTIEEVRATSNG